MIKSMVLWAGLWSSMSAYGSVPYQQWCQSAVILTEEESEAFDRVVPCGEELCLTFYGEGVKQFAIRQALSACEAKREEFQLTKPCKILTCEKFEAYP